MAISIVGATGAKATTVTIPATSANDLILMVAYRSGVNTLATVPAAGGTVPTWNVISPATGTGNSEGVGVYWATAAGSDTSGTWTSASYLSVVVLRGTASGAAAIGGADSSLATGINTPYYTIPAITQVDTSGASALVGFAFQVVTSAHGWSAAPAGYTQRWTGASATITGCIDTKDVTTSDGSYVQPPASGATVTRWTTSQVEIMVPQTVTNPKTLTASTITLSPLLPRKTARTATASTVTLSPTLKRKSVRKLTASAVTLAASVRRKTARKLTASTVTIGTSVLHKAKYLKALTSSAVTLGSSKLVRKTSRHFIASAVTIGTSMSHLKRIGKVLATSIGVSTSPVVRKTLRSLSTSATVPTSLARMVGRHFSTSATVATSLRRKTARKFTTSASLTATLTRGSQYGKVLIASAVRLTMSLPRKTLRRFSVTVSATPSVSRKIGRHLVTSVSTVASLLRGDLYEKVLTTSISLATSLPRKAMRHLSSSVSLTTSLPRTVARKVVVSASTSATVVRATHFFKALTTSASLSALLRRKTARRVVASVSTSATAEKAVHYLKTLAASASLVPTLPRKIGRKLSTSVSTAATIAHTFVGFVFSKTLTTSVTLGASLARRTSKRLSASVSFGLTLPRHTKRALAATVSAPGALRRKTGRVFSTSVSAQTSAGRRVAFLRSLSVSVGAVATLSRRLSLRKALATSVHVAGTLPRKIRKLLRASLSLATTLRRISGLTVVGDFLKRATMAFFDRNSEEANYGRNETRDDFKDAADQDRFDRNPPGGSFD
ncbi:MAG: hypothetical protein ACRD3Q_12435 [Terriglobales bacterium]